MCGKISTSDLMVVFFFWPFSLNFHDFHRPSNATSDFFRHFLYWKNTARLTTAVLSWVYALLFE